MNERRLARTLEDCLSALRGGAIVDECLDAYPEARSQLAPLLATAGSLSAERPPFRPAEARSEGRNQLMAAIAAEGLQERRNVFVPVLPPLDWKRLSFVPLAAIAVAVIVVVFATSQARPAPAINTATVLTVLSGNVQVETEYGLLAASNGMTLRPGDRVLTGEGAKAVLTFFDGSTVTLDAETVVAIEESREQDGALRAVLTQSQGNTWTHIPQDLGPASIEIDTPSARIQANDASFTTRVEDGGRTQVGSQNGALNVTSGANRTEVNSGQQASVEQPGTVGAASDTARPMRELILTVSGPVYAFLTNPDGATIGTLAGVPVNQVTGASASRQGDLLVLRLPEPADGGYKLGLRGTGAGAVSISAVVKNGTDASAAQAIKVENDDNWTLELLVSPGEVAFRSAERSANNLMPDVVTVPDRAIEKARQNATPTPEPTKVPPTATATSTFTATPTGTATPTRIPPTATPTTPVRPTATPTPRIVATKTVAPVKDNATDSITTTDSAVPSSPSLRNAR